MDSNWEEKKRPAKNHLAENSDERACHEELGLTWSEVQAKV